MTHDHEHSYLNTLARWTNSNFLYIPVSCGSTITPPLPEGGFTKAPSAITRWSSWILLLSRRTKVKSSYLPSPGSIPETITSHVVSLLPPCCSLTMSKTKHENLWMRFMLHFCLAWSISLEWTALKPKHKIFEEQYSAWKYFVWHDPYFINEIAEQGSKYAMFTWYKTSPEWEQVYSHLGKFLNTIESFSNLWWQNLHGNNYLSTGTSQSTNGTKEFTTLFNYMVKYQERKLVHEIRISVLNF